jgi:hypothetical protein
MGRAGKHAVLLLLKLVQLSLLLPSKSGTVSYIPESNMQEQLAWRSRACCSRDHTIQERSDVSAECPPIGNCPITYLE